VDSYKSVSRRSRAAFSGACARMVSSTGPATRWIRSGGYPVDVSSAKIRGRSVAEGLFAGPDRSCGSSSRSAGGCYQRLTAYLKAVLCERDWRTLRRSERTAQMRSRTKPTATAPKTKVSTILVVSPQARFILAFCLAEHC
jgi:hypothetical protein